MDSGFLTHYTKVVAEAIPAEFEDNYDAHRFGPAAKPSRKSLREHVRSNLARVGLVTPGAAKNTMLTGMRFVEAHLHQLEWLYKHLSDDESRETLVKVVAYRALDYRKIKLPLNNPDHWSQIKAIGRIADGTEVIPSGFLHFDLARLNLQSIGYPIEMYFPPLGVVGTFVEQQYRCVTSDGLIECENGDVAIDAGGCWGDTALYFAHKAGPQGQVASFEFLPVNLDVFEKNLHLNPPLANRIRLYKNPVWSSSGEKLFVSGTGPATSVGRTANSADALAVETLSIDDMVRTGNFGKVDFIKMDIEGSELAALQGAENSLRKFKPKLAVCVYHALSDFWTIPQYLLQLNLGYRLYLRHFSIHAEETVLFAKA